MPTKTVGKFGRWIATKTDETIGKIMRGASRGSRRIMPSTDGSLLRWITSRIAWSFGMSTAKRQVSAAVTLMIAAVLTSAVGLVGTIVLVFVFLGLAAFGLLRLLVPPVDRGFVAIRDTVIP